MDIRTVETIPTAGSLSDPAFRINGNVESVSLSFDYESRDLILIDNNLNYNVLPGILGDTLVKKTFLTYNGVSCETRQLIQTVVMESDNSSSTMSLTSRIKSLINQESYKESYMSLTKSI